MAQATDDDSDAFRWIPQAMAEVRALNEGDFSRAGPLIEDIAARYPGNRRIGAVLDAYRTAIAFDATGDVTARSRNAAEAVIELNELLGPMHRFNLAKTVLGKYLSLWPTHHSLLSTQAMVPADSKLEDEFRDDDRADIQCVAKPGATTTFLVFTDRSRRFGITLNGIHHCWFAPLGVNVIYIRDFRERLYLRGVQSLGDNEDETVERLKGIIQSLGTRRLVCLGSSRGVFGASYYGIRLAAQYVLIFAGPCSLDVGLATPEKTKFYGMLRRLHEQGLVRWPDLRALYTSHPEIEGRLFFGSDHVADRQHAETFARLPNFSLEPIEGWSTHFVLAALARTGRFKASLAHAADPSLANLEALRRSSDRPTKPAARGTAVSTASDG